VAWSNELPVTRSSTAKACTYKQAAIREGQDALAAGAWDVTNGVGPLHLAAAKGHAALVELLLQGGAPVDGPDGNCATALQVNRYV
jgi:Ankyrin repeat